MIHYKKQDPEITNNFNFNIGIPVINWPEYPLALTALLLGYYWASHTMRVFDFERQLRLFLSIPNTNSRKVKRLKASLAFLKKQKLIAVEGRYTTLQPCFELQRVNISYNTLQCLFAAPWRDPVGLCLVAYMAHCKMVRGTVEGLCADSTARALRMGQKRLRLNAAQLIETGVLTRAESEAHKVKLYRKKKPRPLQEEHGNHQMNTQELRNLLMGKGFHDYEFGRDEDDEVTNAQEPDYWYWVLQRYDGENDVDRA